MELFDKGDLDFCSSRLDVYLVLYGVNSEFLIGSRHNLSSYSIHLVYTGTYSIEVSN
jgi:hypothetical protein